MEKLSLEKFSTSKMSNDQMFKTKGGDKVGTTWKGSNGGSGLDVHDTDTGGTVYDDNAYSQGDGIIYTP